MRVFLIILLVLILEGAMIAFADPPEINRLTNPGFEDGLAGWTPHGDVAVVTNAPLGGKSSVRLGPGVSGISRRYAIGGLRIVLFGAMLKEDPPGCGGMVRAQCYDSAGRVVMDLTQAADPKKASPDGDFTGIYFKTQAHTASLEISIEKSTHTPGRVMVDDAKLVDYDRDQVVHAPLCDLHQYMVPIWEGNTVTNETVLLESVGGKPASGSLLFQPDRILSVRDYGLDTTYIAGKDYTLSGKTITAAPRSRMPTVKDSDFPTGSFPWYQLDGKHIVVTYIHGDRWTGPTPLYRGDKLKHVIDLLQKRRPVTIVADGDSITLGDNTSGTIGIPPYMPTWAELFAGAIRQEYGDDRVTLYNTALGGMTSDWGRDNAASAVASLHPDLVLIGFGMNDFWWMPPSDFRKNILGIMDIVRATSPHADFILISSIPFDPAYTSDPTYTSNMAGYVDELHSLTGDGVQMLDMHAIGGALYAAKKPTDLIPNPMHPNDFLARWYAQGLAAMLIRRLSLHP